jgi:hypothetical protein
MNSISKSIFDNTSHFMNSISKSIFDNISNYLTKICFEIIFETPFSMTYLAN